MGQSQLESRARWWNSQSDATHSLHYWRPPKERWTASLPKEALMMARYGGGRPGSSRRVRLVPVRHSGMDHRAVARIVLALARQMAADQAVESAAVEAASSGAEVCARNEPGTSDGSAAASDAAAPWAGAHSGQSARGGTSVGRCAANEPVSPGTGVCARSERIASVGRCAANEPLSASAGSGLAGRCARQRHEGARYLAHGTPSTTPPVLPDRVGTAKTDEDAAVSSTPGGAP